MSHFELIDEQHRLDVRAALRGALADGGFALQRVPEYTLHVIQTKAWLPTFASLRELVEADVLEGGFHDSVENLIALCKGKPTEVPLREALKGKPGRPKAGEQSGHIVTRKGNARSYALARLQRERPDLAERVDAGELTPHAAAVQAGFRTPTATIPVDTPQAAMRALRRRFAVDELRKALDAL